MDLRPIFYVNGFLLSVLSLSMILPMMADWYFGSDDWKVFFICIIVTSFFGGAMILSNTGRQFTLSIRQAFLLTASSWIVSCLFAAVPFWLTSLNLSATDSFFEAMSGITTTGSTVIVGLEHAPAGILLWRAILQWLGGVGIIIMTLSVLPVLNIGGMQIFRTELAESENALPRATRLAGSIGLIYAGLTILCALCYMGCGFEVFDAVTHAMTTISTGGFSTYDSSFRHYATTAPYIVAIFFMILGGMPFVLYLKAVHGSLLPLLRDSQVRWFLSILLISAIILTAALYRQGQMGLGTSILHAVFSTVSIMTGTGYVSDDFNRWGSFAFCLLLFLMVVGGCAGSTSCGIKIFRFQILYEICNIQIKKLLYPSGVFIHHYNGRTLPGDIPSAVMGFFFMYGLIYVILCIALSLVGLDVITAISGAATAISNVGPGLGDIIGPTGSFQPLPDSAKWILSFGMLTGRLEIFTLLVMIAPGFWRK